MFLILNTYLLVGNCALFFVIKKLSCLVEATVAVTVFDERFICLNAILLQGISGAKRLSWSTSSFDARFDLPLPKFPNLKHLELKGSLSFGWLSLFEVLESSSELAHLCIEEPEEAWWIKPKSVPICMRSSLRTMKFTRCKWQGWDLGLLEYILGNAEVLKTLTITRESLPLKEEMWLSARLVKFPRASRDCEIHFVGNWPHSEDD